MRDAPRPPAKPNANPPRVVPIRVVVREDADPDVIVHDKTGDHGDKLFRDWIASTTWWAMREGKTVHLYPVTA